MKTSYAEIALELGVSLCTGCDAYQHRRGAVGWAVPMRVHWAERQVNVVGLYRFLKLAALAQHPEIMRRMGWERLYAQNVLAVSLARRIHRILPRQLADLDRAQVRFLLFDIPEYQLRRYDERTQRAYRRATRWAYPE